MASIGIADGVTRKRQLANATARLGDSARPECRHCPSVAWATVVVAVQAFWRGLGRAFLKSTVRQLAPLDAQRTFWAVALDDEQLVFGQSEKLRPISPHPENDREQQHHDDRDACPHEYGPHREARRLLRFGKIRRHHHSAFRPR